MSGGSGSPTRTTQVQEPWKGVQPYLISGFSRADELSRQGPSYYGGDLTVGALPSEEAAFRQQGDYNTQVFGGQPALRYGQLTGAVGDTASGATTLGGMSRNLAPGATDQITQSFARGPASVGDYSGLLSPYGAGPQFGRAGSLDATGAYGRMLEGTPDYEGVQGAIEAANAPILRQFEQDILPSVNQRSLVTNNPTGGIKTLNRVLPDIGERMALNAQTITNQERIRALGAQERAASDVAQGGLSSYGLGLQGAGDMARLRLGTDELNANLGDRFRGDALNYGSLAGQLASTTGQQQLGALGLAPSIYEMGRQPSTDALGQAAWQRGLAEDALSADQERFDYLRDQPYDALSWYSGLVQPGAGMGGSVATTGRQPGGSRAAGALGGALAGGQMGSSFGPWGTAIGALLGGAGGYFGS